MSLDTFTDYDLLPTPTSHATLAAEIVVLRHELAEARTALRSLVDAAIDHRVVGYRLVNEDAMNVAMALILEWFGSASEKGEPNA